MKNEPKGEPREEPTQSQFLKAFPVVMVVLLLPTLCLALFTLVMIAVRILT